MTLGERDRSWVVILAVWTAWGLVSSAQQHVTFGVSRGYFLPWWLSLLLQMPQAWMWALATPAILWLGRRFPLERGRWPLSSAVHVTVCLAWVYVVDTSFTFHADNVLPSMTEQRTLFERGARAFAVWALFDSLLYWMVLSVGYALQHYRRSRERELATSQLQTQLAQAELQSLKMQLHPHFLFNALHSIGALVRTGDRDTAVRVVARLGDLLRRLMDGAAEQEVPLEREMSFIRGYLEIEEIRFRDRLRVEIDAAPDTLDAMVPHLVLQPLVENAIVHGIAPHASAGRVAVTARRAGTRLELVVRDDGPGIGEGESRPRPGIGLANTRARLSRLYADDYTLDVLNGSAGGLEARLSIPFRPCPAGWESAA